MKKLLITLMVLCMVSAGFAGCGSSAKGGDEASKDDPLRVVLIGNQKFGDNGPMDDMAAGGEKAAKEFGIEFKKMESEPVSFEEDIRTMVQEGYDLVITTFPYMSEATKTLALESPDTKFAAIFQSINEEGNAIPNLWDTKFVGQTTLYVDGYMAGLATKTNKLGLIVGGEEPSPNSEGNGFMRGVHDANPNATVEFAYASYEDTAKVKEIALAMINKGVDFIQGDCGSADSGIVEAVNESKKDVMLFSVICDFTDSCDNFAGSIGMNYGSAVYDAMKSLHEGNFPGGTQGIRDILNDGYFLDWPTYQAFAERSQTYGPAFAKAIEEGMIIEGKIKSGDLEVPYDPEVPNWDRISSL